MTPPRTMRPYLYGARERAAKRMVKLERKSGRVYLYTHDVTEYFRWPAKFRGGEWDQRERCFVFPGESEAEVRDLVERFRPIAAALPYYRRALERRRKAERRSEELMQYISTLCENRGAYGKEYDKEYCRAWSEYEVSKEPRAEARAALEREYEHLMALLNDFISTPTPPTP